MPYVNLTRAEIPKNTVHVLLLAIPMDLYPRERATTTLENFSKPDLV